MRSEGTTDVSRGQPWWWWALLPIILPIALLLLAFILLWMAALLPFAMISGWRSGRRAERKLKAEGRQIDWKIALLECSPGDKELVVEIGPKNIGHLWLVELSSTDRTRFESYPTYSDYEVDPRIVWDRCDEMNEDDVKHLVPHMRAAKRINGSPKTISNCDKH